MFKRKGKYYFMWSEGGWTGPDYSVAHAIGDSPFGPFKRIGKILQQDPAIATGAGHHSFIYIPGTGIRLKAISPATGMWVLVLKVFLQALNTNMINKKPVDSIRIEKPFFMSIVNFNSKEIFLTLQFMK